VPCLFADDAEAILGLIEADPHKIVSDIGKLVKLFPSYEIAILAEAQKVVASPREGSTTFPFKKAKGKKGRMAKKSKQSVAGTISDTGSSKKNLFY
jgi:hypothetical protein